MAAPPRWKVYTRNRVYIAACHFAEDAAAVVAINGHDATIRDGHRHIVFTQGVDGDAGESFDRVARLCRERADRT